MLDGIRGKWNPDHYADAAVPLSILFYYKKAVLSQGEPHDAAVNFNTYRILQRHRAVSLSQQDFLVYISDHSNAEITHSMLIFTALT